MDWPVSITASAREVDALFWLVLVIVGIWLAAAEAFLIACVWRFRQGRPQRVFGSGVGVLARRVILLLAAAVLVCDFAIEAASLPVWRSLKEAFPAGDVEVRALARQFSWRFVYPGGDRVFGTEDDHALDNELHVPVGKELRLQLRSQDVIHSFFIPAARIKQDVVPGREAVVWLRPERAGRFEIACAELCGFAHYTMRAYLYVHTAAEYQQWLEQEQAGASRSAWHDERARGVAEPNG